MRTETTIKAVNSIAAVSMKGRRVNGLFRLMTNPEILWKQAYANIYPNKGAITKGVNENTLDGFSEERVNHMIGMLAKSQYCPKPVRRTYIPKKNGKMRPLGIPTGDDKLVQEVVRILLERIYEPVFSKHSHGFRPRKSCHTALQQVHDVWTGVKWIIEFDIKGFFDNINHTKLIELLEKKIDDKHVINIIRKMLKAGYLENWQHNATWSGTPQGGVISPVLANIYLHELDVFMENMMWQFNKGKRRKDNPAHALLRGRMQVTNQKLNRLKMGLKCQKPEENTREKLLRKRRELQKSMHEIPSTDLFDPDYRRLRYVRYADDFIIGVIGSREDAERVMLIVKQFIERELLLEAAEDKTCIKSAKKGVRFLGYDIRSYTGNKRLKMVNGNGTCLKLTMIQKMQLHVPPEKVLPKPPARFTEASLVKQLEKAGIGRPATYATILDNITTQKNYLQVDGKRNLVPTEAGLALVEHLNEAFCFMNLDFTRELEAELDEIAAGKKEYKNVVSAANGKLSSELKAFNDQHAHHCPECGRNLIHIYRKSGDGSNFWGCSGYPECRYTARDEGGKPGAKNEKKETLISEFKCTCGKGLIRRQGTSKKGNKYDFFGCAGYPGCEKTFWAKDDGTPDYKESGS